MKKLGLIKKDIIVIFALIIAGSLMGAILFVMQLKNTPDECSVSVNGEIVGEYSLNVDGEYDIKGDNGAYNRLIIKDKKACIKDASCPDKLCEKMGYIEHSGQSIICLPNKVVVSIDNGRHSSIDSKTW